MPTEEFMPDLGTLHDHYQILTELHYSVNARVYLARHLELNRDVTITVVRAPDGGDTLSQFAADARVLTVKRHRNVIPVIEGRWLSDGTFAIVRARVRGSSLDQLVESSGPLPLPRVARTLEQVNSAVAWARANGVVHRHIAAGGIVFQQGSGRVLLALDPRPVANGIAEACEDARTIGWLTYEMLSGQRDGDPAARPLSVARPDLLPEIVRETESLMRCDSASPRDAARLITLLGGRVGPAAATPPRVRAVASPAVPATGSLDDAVVVVKRGPSFNARLASAIAVVAIIAALGLVLLDRDGPTEKLTASLVDDTTREAAGDVALPAQRPDTYSVRPRIMRPAPTSPATPAAPIVSPIEDSLKPKPRSDSTMATRPLPPETRRPEPPIAAPPSVVPPLAVTTSTPKPVTAAFVDPATTGDVCDSSDAGDQHTCLLTTIERGDRELLRTYGSLIAALRQEAGVRDTDPDPPPVDDLRADERRWLDERDAACRNVGDGPLYARTRAQCFTEASAARARKLADRLAAIQPR